VNNSVLKRSRWSEFFPWSRFSEFINLAADRFALLEGILKESDLSYKVLDIAGNRHFFVSAQPHSSINKEEFPDSRPVILVAHYDRAEKSPGANDNSAAVFMLIETAMKLKAKKKAGNWALIFTDKEELHSGESICDQGAYTLAQRLRESGMEAARIFNFDACGTGDTIIISTTAEHLLKTDGGSERLYAAIRNLQELCLKIARAKPMVNIRLAPTPFSDDAGFLRAGLAAQTITVLPSEECTGLLSQIRKKPSFAEALVSRKEQEALDLKSIPCTWRNMNGPGDNYSKLTPENFSTVIGFAEALCGV
jgi:hypothetical protein